MSELPERYRHLDERRDLVAAGVRTVREVHQAVGQTLLTMDHACRVFERAVELLGERGLVDPGHHEARRELLVRDRERPKWLVPFAVAERVWAAASSTVAVGPVIKLGGDPPPPADAPAGWKPGDPPFRTAPPPLDILPKSADMRAGELTLREGPSYWTFSFGADGRRREMVQSAVDQFTHYHYAALKPYTIDPTARPPTPRPVGIALRADLDPAGHTNGDFARMVAELDPERFVPARVCLPVPLPYGAHATFLRGLPALRLALWSDRVPAEARWLVADGYDGSATAWGDTFDQAIARWTEEVARVVPLPPGYKAVTPIKSPAPPADLQSAEPGVHERADGKSAVVSLGTFSVSFQPPPAPVAWPPPDPATTPAVLVPLPPLPDAVPARFDAAGFTRWVRLVGAFGHVAHALLRDQGDGAFTLIGEGALDLVADPGGLDAALDEVDRRESAEFAELPQDSFRNPYTDPEYPWCCCQYRGWDDGHQRPAPWSRGAASFGGLPSAAGFDGDGMKWVVTRAKRRSS